MTYDVAAFVLTLALALFAINAVYGFLLDHWGDDELEYHDLPPARSHVVLLREPFDEDGAA